MKKDKIAINKMFFTGIGGIGMSALARYFQSRGVQISGYDRTSTDLSRQLEKEGMQIIYEDNPGLIPQDVDLVVYTPAIPPDNRILSWYRKHGFPVYKRAELLGMITADKYLIAVAGSHGKTTVTAMITHILKQSGFDCTGLIGGISLNYDSNYIPGSEEMFIVEADEFDRSFLHLKPDIAVITAIDTDHLDIYGNMEQIEIAFLDFAFNLKEGGAIVVEESVAPLVEITGKTIQMYSCDNPGAAFYLDNLVVKETGFLMDVKLGKEYVKEVELNIPGIYNVENALAAMGVAYMLGIEPDVLVESLATFKGLKRRFEIHIMTSDLVYIDDYAHHPHEIERLIESVRIHFPGRKITAIFQPHLYSRTRDLAHGFADSLSMVDELILLDIYPARENPIPGVTADLIFEKVEAPKKSRATLDNVIDLVAGKNPDVLLTIGAGNIDSIIEPLKKRLLNKVSRR